MDHINWRTRLNRVSRRFDARHNDNARGYPLLELLTRWVVANQPDLRLVEPCDTDSATYGRIRERVDVADGRVRLPAPRRSNPAMLYARADPAKLEATRARLVAMSREWEEESVRENAAIAAARQRIGRPHA
jgi:hypothetical protein